MLGKFFSSIFELHSGSNKSIMNCALKDKGLTKFYRIHGKCIIMSQKSY